MIPKARYSPSHPPFERAQSIFPHSEQDFARNEELAS